MLHIEPEENNNLYPIAIDWKGKGWYAGSQVFGIFLMHQYGDDPENVPDRYVCPPFLSSPRWLNEPEDAWR